MGSAEDISDYAYEDAGLGHAHQYLLPVVLRQLDRIVASGARPKIFELGCGNGSVANEFAVAGYEVTGVDPSAQGIAYASLQYPELKLARGSAYDDLAGKYGQFPIVISLEVVEHLYYPRKYAQALYRLVEPGGWAIVSTPYHGYWKNLALAATGKLDGHFTALWDHGHIKFWSLRTLRQLLEEAGFSDVSFQRVGRVSILAKSMIAVARRIR